MTKYLDSAGLAHLVRKIKAQAGSSSTSTRAAGLIMPYAGAKAPAGYLLCNGAPYSKTDYPELFAAIGTTYGGSGSTFNVPNLGGRVPLGANGSYAVGSTGGEATHKLTAAELPEHKHKVGVDTEYFAPGGSWQYSAHDAGVSGSETYTWTSGIYGMNGEGDSEQPHNNMQPYLATNYVISTGKRTADDQTTADDLVDRLNGYEAETQALIASKVKVGTAAAPATGAPLSIYVQILS